MSPPTEIPVGVTAFGRSAGQEFPSTMKPTIDSQLPGEAPEATETTAIRRFTVLGQAYNELVNRVLIGTASTADFWHHEPLLRSRAHRLLRGLAGNARQRLALRSAVYLTRRIAQSSEPDTLAEERRNAELTLLCGYDPALLGSASLLVHHMHEAEVLKHALHEVESMLSGELSVHALALVLAKRICDANPDDKSPDSFKQTASLVAIRGVLQEAIGSSVNPTVCRRGSGPDG
jgi:hypothetical protein